MTAHRGAFSHRIRELHSSDIFLAEKAKHPDDKHAEELARDHNNSASYLGNKHISILCSAIVLSCGCDQELLVLSCQQWDNSVTPQSCMA